MTTLKVFGNPDMGLKEVNFGTELKNFRISDAVQISSDRASSTPQIIQRLKNDDIVELIFEGGIHRWVTVGELEEKYRNQLSRGAEPGVLEIPSRLSVGGTSRAAGTVVLTALRVIKFDPAEMTADLLAETFDKKISPNPGLFRLDQGPEVRGEEIKTQIKVEDGKPILLFIHGTFSTIAGGFGKLPQKTWTVLKQSYGDQIFGFDHRTLSLSPIENALELVRKLPDKANLHIVTHSRGGLVGELLCRLNRMDGKDPFEDEDLELFADSRKTTELLTTLSRELKKRKKLKVERFVRVACPVRGTTLASKRMDDYLTLLVNIIEKVLPPGPVTVGVGVLTDLLLEIKKQSRNPKPMPGLAAMDPESNFIKMINRHGLELGGNLSVVAGDIEKSGLLGTLAVTLADLFYRDDHDLVVHTPGMFGGPLRKEGHYFFHKGPNVTHVTYFANERTAQIVHEALTLPFDKLDAKGFQHLVDPDAKPIPELESGKRSFQKRSNLIQPVVYILPGIMGTHLSERGSRIWLNPKALANGQMDDLDIDNGNVQPQALMDFAYGKLVEYLSATHEVIPFPYDWRKSILAEADRFGKALEEKLEKTTPGQPIRIIGHSMGGLVTRAMISLRPDLWKKIREREGARFVMLGTPNRGSYMIPRVIFGQDITLRMLALFDFKNPAHQLLKIIVRYPGLLQLLPIPEDGKWNFAEPDTWDKFPNFGRKKWTKPQKEDLDQVRKLHELLDKGTGEDLDSTVYVAGYDRGAPVAVEIEAGDKIVFQATDRGDGTVPWESGILPRLRSEQVYYMRAKHGDMAKHRDSFGAIYDLLNEGKTTRLSNTPPVDRSQEVRYPLKDEDVEMYPTLEDFEAAVLGASPLPPQEQTAQPVRVSVVHGNLSFCSNPVAVGHYEGDDLYSAERDMDRHLNGRLNVRLQLGLYPGSESTVEVFLNDRDKKPRGAIIVGLGKAGELSPNKLSNSFANALREYGVKAVEYDMVGEDGELKISSLLIGSGGTGLSISSSMDAILNAVLQANKSFSQIAYANPGGPRHQYNIRVAEIQFVELYKDQAILAVKALEPFLDNPDFSIDPKLQSIQGGWKRVAYTPPTGWWNRIHIRAEEKRDDSLVFSVPSDRARSEESRLEVQRRSMDRLIEQAVQIPTWDQALATSMFELLIPNRIKGSFKDLDSVLFVVDREAARYPWELLYDRRSGRDLPLVIHAGMIRQFSTSSFEERVIDVRNKNVMVIGNPKDTPADFPNLPGAEQEATLVAAKLKEYGFDVQPEIFSEPGSIMNHLFSKDYRVLHLAGHGVFEYKYRESEVYTGMVLGNGIFLTANEIRQKMNIPELVFINCCHLGKFSSPEEDKTPKYAFNHFAASLSEELIKMGVKAVIAAGWAVDDDAALTFAEAFYDHMLKGYRFGDAVKEARIETYRLHKDRTNTWGAYQCYGDPAYRLVIDSEEDQGGSERFVDIDEAVAKINQLHELAKTAQVQGIGIIRDRLKQLSTTLEKEEYRAWLTNARLLDALGEAYGEVFSFDEAVKYYEPAIKSGRSTASIRAIEQSANFQIRLSVQEYENGLSAYGASRRKIRKQIDTLKQLTRTIGGTEDRLSIIAGGYKRLAQIAGGTNAGDCTAALKEMEKYYELAWKKDKGTYPLANALTAKIVQLLRAGKPNKTKLPGLRKQIAEVRQRAEEDASRALDDFWATTGITNVKLLAYLHENVSGRRKAVKEIFHGDELVAEYKSAWKQYGSARELNSIIEQYAFLVAVLRDVKKHKTLHKVIENILNSLKAAYHDMDS